jgi:ergothioneine biosynthesis protein EgtB
MTDRPHHPVGAGVARAAHLAARFREVRSRTERLAAPLSAEDQCLQSQPSSSPTKWHRAHTTWFFETFLLAPRGVAPVDPRWGLLFNSYYEALGARHPRAARGLLSRPSAPEITEYRRVVDGRVEELLAAADGPALAELHAVVELGLAHEEQHQELLLTDILHALHQSPLRPSYRSSAAPAPRPAMPSRPMRYRQLAGGVVEIGAARDGTFRFDNEEPRHRVFVDDFQLADRLVTVAEWKAFADAGGYETPSLWLSDGYDWVRAHGVGGPLYSRREGGVLVVFGLDGEREALDDEPLAHVSFYEADAIARFHGARLPTEAEWEIAAGSAPVEGNFLDEAGSFRVLPAPGEDRPHATQMFGDAWEWTASPYGPYPGFVPPAGAIGEYNGKFMVNQIVLRGGSCFTPPGHVRRTYRNFWPPETRFQVTGVRLARPADGATRG